MVLLFWMAIRWFLSCFPSCPVFWHFVLRVVLHRCSVKIVLGDQNPISIRMNLGRRAMLASLPRFIRVFALPCLALPCLALAFGAQSPGDDDPPGGCEATAHAYLLPGFALPDRFVVSEFGYDGGSNETSVVFSKGFKIACFDDPVVFPESCKFCLVFSWLHEDQGPPVVHFSTKVDRVVPCSDVPASARPRDELDGSYTLSGKVVGFHYLSMSIYGGECPPDPGSLPIDSYMQYVGEVF
jgi:hypothetical protein